jgi:hypothetical protein
VNHSLAARQIWRINFIFAKRPCRKLSDKEKLQDFWWQIWEEYTSCDLTYPEADKLAGLSSITNQLAIAMNDVYVVGHFCKTFPHSLCWQTRPTLGARERSYKKARKIEAMAGEDADGVQDQIPSWSWASMDGPLYISRQLEKYAPLANAETYLSTPIDSVFKQIHSVKLNLSARCVEIEWKINGPTILNEHWAIVGNCYTLKIYMDDENVTTATGSRMLLVALLEDDWLRQWQGLVVQEIGNDGVIPYHRIGYYLVCHGQGESRRSEWREDYQTIFGERTVISLALEGEIAPVVGQHTREVIGFLEEH